MSAVGSELDRLRGFWNRRYQDFNLSESGWLGAGDRLNHYIYRGKTRALQQTLTALGFDRPRAFSVLDAGCGQGYFAAFYRGRYPAAQYVGVDISERAIAHLRRTEPRAEFHLADLCAWRDPSGRRFDVIQSIDVMYLILDDRLVADAIANLATHLTPRGALLINLALPADTRESSGYLRYRSRRFWEELLATLGLANVSERPMYYWLPAGGPTNRYLRYAMNCLGPATLYAVDRAALALGLPPPRESMDCRMRLVTISSASVQG